MELSRKRKATNSKVSRARTRDRNKTRQLILDIAFEEFAESGLSGGNTDVIADRSGITKRLIFYYFKSKEKLFREVLEAAYKRMRIAEEDLGLDALAPEAAIRTLAEFTFDFDHANPGFVRLVTIENIHRGRHMETSQKVKEMARPVIDQIERVLARGVKAGVIRAGLNPTEVHMTLSALCFFSVANRHTFEPQFDYDMSTPEAKAVRKAEIADLLWRYVRAG